MVCRSRCTAAYRATEIFLSGGSATSYQKIFAQDVAGQVAIATTLSKALVNPAGQSFCKFKRGPDAAPYRHGRARDPYSRSRADSLGGLGQSFHIDDKAIFHIALQHAFVGIVIFETGIISISEVMLCSPQKSSISCVSLIPPINEPASWRRRKISGKAATGAGSGGAPTSVKVPSPFQQFKYAFRS